MTTIVETLLPQLTTGSNATNPRLIQAAHDAHRPGKFVATSYALYRIVRLLPSLIPPLWPTLPINVTLP